MRKRKIAAGIALAVVVLFALLSIPAPDPVIAQGAADQPFLWKQDETWNALETSFREARSVGCNGLKAPIDEDFRKGRQTLASLAAAPFGPNAPVFTELESNLFSLGHHGGRLPGEAAGLHRPGDKNEKPSQAAVGKLGHERPCRPGPSVPFDLRRADRPGGGHAPGACRFLPGPDQGRQRDVGDPLLCIAERNPPQRRHPRIARRCPHVGTDRPRQRLPGEFFPRGPFPCGRQDRRTGHRSKHTSRWGSWSLRSKPISRTRSSGSWCFASGRICRR